MGWNDCRPDASKPIAALIARSCADGAEPDDWRRDASGWGHSPEWHAAAARSHQQAMGAQNVIGATLERYLDSVPRPHGWHWCCGSFVRAIDFLYKRPDGEWFALQAKNRDNSKTSPAAQFARARKSRSGFDRARTAKPRTGRACLR
jgi:hypothetical protein